MAGPTLDVVEVTERFGGVAALAGCTLEVAPGTITGLIGPNGAGKTTPFNTISGLVTPDSGEIRLGPHRLDGLAKPPCRAAGAWTDVPDSASARPHDGSSRGSSCTPKPSAAKRPASSPRHRQEAELSGVKPSVRRP
jgi:energy-coupling factor transporter ATP-binding protein EcfA2